MRRRDDSGQLMLLSGVVVTIAFILTSLTLAQVSSLERQAATDRAPGLAEEWRFLHAKLGSALRAAIASDTSNDTFVDSSWPAIVATYRNIEAEQGLDLVLRIAGESTLANLSEVRILAANGTHYDVVDIEGERDFDFAWDGVDDGLLWQKPCPDTTGPSAGCISGVLVYAYLTDGVSTMEEILLVAVNTE